MHFLCDKLPSAALQFAKARAVQPWVSTERLQFSSSQSVGSRYCLLSHASGFLDALYSRGLINSCEIVRSLATPLLESIQDGDWSDERFAPIEQVHNRVLSFADRLVDASFASWTDFEVWDWVVRIWAVAVGVTESNLGSYLLRCFITRPQWGPECHVHLPFVTRNTGGNAGHIFIIAFLVTTQFSDGL
jgi:FADH2 O2-dependent halogenase